ncbi:Twitchin [Eumeta japonica]|uniref:Twitchin n=1 Tax=Eumeta variegata TaxID=151549 RepID=A0A4C1T408_EUMVA|nr:Twitchin [Eumeta japonica]
MPKVKRLIRVFTLSVRKNDSGTDTRGVELEVLCKPSKPKDHWLCLTSPLESVHLKWNKPDDDDGGESIELMLLNAMDTETRQMGTCINYQIAEADVTGLTQGKEYLFRVKAVNAGVNLNL